MRLSVKLVFIFFLSLTSCYLVSGGVEVIVTLKDTTQSAGLLWTSDQPVAETSS